VLRTPAWRNGSGTTVGPRPGPGRPPSQWAEARRLGPAERRSRRTHPQRPHPAGRAGPAPTAAASAISQPAQERERQRAAAMACCCARRKPNSDELQAACAEAAAHTSVHEFTLTAQRGGPLPLKDLTAGKVCLIVNTASACGLTPQFEGLQRLHDKHTAANFTVLGVRWPLPPPRTPARKRARATPASQTATPAQVPCNQFFAQEKGDDACVYAGVRANARAHAQTPPAPPHPTPRAKTVPSLRACARRTR